MFTLVYMKCVLIDWISLFIFHPHYLNFRFITTYLPNEFKEIVVIGHPKHMLLFSEWGGRKYVFRTMGLDFMFNSMGLSHLRCRGNRPLVPHGWCLACDCHVSCDCHEEGMLNYLNVPRETDLYLKNTSEIIKN